MNTKAKLISKLKNKKYRNAFVTTYIDQGIPFQIRALREQRHWSQEKLASEAGMQQEAISRAENPNIKGFTLKTLKQLAAGFDVGLIVRFVPISSIVEWVNNLPNTSLEVLSFEEEPYFQEEEKEEIDQNFSASTKTSDIIDAEKSAEDSVYEAIPEDPLAYGYKGDMIPTPSDKIQVFIL